MRPAPAVAGRSISTAVESKESKSPRSDFGRNGGYFSQLQLLSNSITMRFSICIERFTTRYGWEIALLCGLQSVGASSENVGIAGKLQTDTTPRREGMLLMQCVSCGTGAAFCS